MHHTIAGKISASLGAALLLAAGGGRPAAAAELQTPKPPPESKTNAVAGRLPHSRSAEFGLVARAVSIAVNHGNTNLAAAAVELRADCIAAIRQIQPQLPKLTAAAPDSKDLPHLPSLLMALGNNAVALTSTSEAARQGALRNFETVTNRVTVALQQLEAARVRHLNR